MKQADREILETLNRQDQPRYASWLISRNKRRYGLFSAQDLAEDFLAPLVRAGPDCVADRRAGRRKAA